MAAKIKNCLTGQFFKKNTNNTRLSGKCFFRATILFLSVLPLNTYLYKEYLLEGYI